MSNVQNSSETPKPVITEKQARRINAPARNMVISMLVMIAILIPILLLVPRLTSNQNMYNPQVDVPAIAYQSTQEAGYPVAAPTPDDWTYNFARWNSNQTDKIDFWNSGVVSPGQQYVELTQASDTNPSWVAQKTNNSTITGEAEVAGITWETREGTEKDENTKREKTVTYYVGEVGSTTVILSSESGAEPIEQWAQQVVDYSKSPSHTAEPTPSNTSGIQ